MLTVKTIEEIYGLFQKKFATYDQNIQHIQLQNALGRTLAENLHAHLPLPHFHRSVVDGYAVLMEDVLGVSQTMPALLQSLGDAHMGMINKETLEPGQTMYVPTGGMVPEGTEAMVMIEYSERIGKNMIALYQSCAPYQHMMLEGDEIKENDLLLKKGHQLTPRDLGLLAAFNQQDVPVVKSLKIGFIPTGDELIPLGTVDQIPKGKIMDINTILITSLIKSWGYKVVEFPIVKDHLQDMKESIEKAIGQCDCLLISGGSSVGIRDFTSDAIESIEDGKVLSHGISMKPGKPTIIGEIKKKPVIGLPGQPVSAYMVTEVIIKQLLSIMSGEGLASDASKKERGYMGERVHGVSGRTTFQIVKRGIKEGELIAVRGKSGMVSLLTKGIGYIMIHRDQEGVEKGEEVQVIYF